jgi:pyruvate/2-oxoglutarate dehydrogenase complex dihydrolipoamide acyltransferase (E2) component
LNSGGRRFVKQLEQKLELENVANEQALARIETDLKVFARKRDLMTVRCPVEGVVSAIFVKPGEKVVRGQLIGKVGNTGGVTGPHLHYEVIHMGQVVNPINYFNRNMTNEEYERLMEQMQELNLDTFDE